MLEMCMACIIYFINLDNTCVNVNSVHGKFCCSKHASNHHADLMITIFYIFLLSCNNIFNMQNYTISNENIFVGSVITYSVTRMLRMCMNWSTRPIATWRKQPVNSLTQNCFNAMRTANGRRKTQRARIPAPTHHYCEIWCSSSLKAKWDQILLKCHHFSLMMLWTYLKFL